jgi:CMP-N-acetylneuraminic acid synthetase
VLTSWFEENSNIHIFSSPSFGKTNDRLVAKPVLFPTSLEESINIDTPEDWHLGESLIKVLKA